MKIAITGGIGSGKSYVCRQLEALGIQVYDCDSAAKLLMRTSPQLKQQLCRLIGDEAYRPDGSLNKAEVSRFLLQSEANKLAINAIVHPAVIADFEQSGLQWMESAILYETGIDHLVDRVVAVTAPEEVRIKRIMQRDGITRQKAVEWVASQWPQDEVRRRAHFEIVNDGRPLEPQITQIIQTLNQNKQ